MDLENHYRHSNKHDCSFKKAFPSRRLASEFNNKLRRHSGLAFHGKKIEKLRVYRCKNCSQYHVGHAPRVKDKYKG